MRGGTPTAPARAAAALLGPLLLLGGLAAAAPQREAGVTAPPHASPPPAAAPGGHMSGAPIPAAADVASPEAVVAAFYASISAPAGKKRDWNRFLSLFFPGARLLPAEGRGHSGNMPEIFSAETYLYNTEPYMLQVGYIEKEIAHTSQRFGKIVHVWSTYRVRHADSDPKPFVRGVNSFQLFFDGSRWWIFSLAWQPETPRLPLPDELPR
jgi:hypothetical protein